MMYSLKVKTILTGIILLMMASGCQQNSGKQVNIPEGKAWKKQGIDKILVPWTKKAVDDSSNTFHTYLDRKWQPYNGTNKYPGMISRHVFSYSVGYMLTGDQSYIDKASELVDYMIDNGWDKEYGGWYDELSKTGAVKDSAKDGFYQTYAVTGLVMYYMATHDSEVLEYIKKSHEILSNEAWDDQYGGYYRKLNRDLSVADSSKSFSPQFAPLSGYLIYLYQATKNDIYRVQMEKMMNVALDKMRKEKSPWILEQFNRKWEYTNVSDKKRKELNTGHNAELVWMLLRLHELTDEKSWRKEALTLADSLYEYTFDDSSGVWYHKFGKKNPSLHTKEVSWWVQVYGNMTSMYLYHVTGDKQYLKAFRQGAKFWNSSFIDEQYGGAYLSVNPDGSILRGAKAVRTKTSYHSMEHALLNYLYTNLWVHHKPATLYFHVTSSEKGEKLYPFPLEADRAFVSKVKIDGKKYTDFNEDYIRLPGGKGMKIKVILKTKQK